MNYEIDKNDRTFEDYINPIEHLALYEEDITRVDTENFIYSLPYENTVVLLFQSMGFNIREIAPMLRFTSLSYIYRITVDNKNRANKRYN